MFYAFEVEDAVRIHPSLFGQDIMKVAERVLKERYENTYDGEMGYIILVKVLEVDPLGKLLSGDGSAYHRVRMRVISFKPLVNEIVEGEVTEITDFGVFVRVGPLDALLHISQVMNDYVTVDPTQGMLRGKETGKVLRVGDIVRARIVAVSPPRGLSIGKIGLTTRQPYLGKIEWIKEELGILKEGEEGEKKR